MPRALTRASTITPSASANQNVANDTWHEKCNEWPQYLAHKRKRHKYQVKDFPNKTLIPNKTLKIKWWHFIIICSWSIRQGDRLCLQSDWTHRALHQSTQNNRAFRLKACGTVTTGKEGKSSATTKKKKTLLRSLFMLLSADADAAVGFVYRAGELHGAGDVSGDVCPSCCPDVPSTAERTRWHSLGQF